MSRQIPPQIRIPSARPSSRNQQQNPLAAGVFRKPPTASFQTRNSNITTSDNNSLQEVINRAKDPDDKSRQKLSKTNLPDDSKQQKSQYKSELRETINSLFRRTSKGNHTNVKQTNVDDNSQILNQVHLKDNNVVIASVVDAAESIEHDAPLSHSQHQIDLSEQASTAPNVNLNHLLSLSQSSYAKGTNLPNLDVSYLSSFLYSEDEVTDENIPWNWDYLYTSIVDESRNEWLDVTGEASERIKFRKDQIQSTNR